MGPELSQLISLQELDLEIQRIEDRITSIPSLREEIEYQFNQHAAEFLEIKNQHEQKMSDRQRLDGELNETQQRHDKFKQDLMRVNNEKAYITALREIDSTKKQIGIFETEILKLMEEIEKLEAQLDIYAPDVERKRNEVDEQLSSLDRELIESRQQLEIIRNDRKTLAASIQSDALSIYERVARNRRGQALSEVVDGTCMACRMRVRPKVFSDVRKGDTLITCDSCSRILYYRPDTSKSVEATLT